MHGNAQKTSIMKMSDQHTVVGKFRNMPELDHARMLLESEGINVVVDDEHTIQMDWFLSNAVGGLKLKVIVEDAERARAILKEKLYDQVDPELEKRVQKSRPLFKWAIVLSILLAVGVNVLSWNWGKFFGVALWSFVPIWIVLNWVYASRGKRDN